MAMTRDQAAVTIGDLTTGLDLEGPEQKRLAEALLLAGRMAAQIELPKMAIQIFAAAAVVLDGRENRTAIENAIVLVGIDMGGKLLAVACDVEEERMT